MKKILLCLGLLFVFAPLVFSGPNVSFGVDKGDLDGFQEVTVTSLTVTTLISTGSTVGYVYTDFAIKNYGSYDIFISTDSAVPAGARWRLEVGESMSPNGTTRKKAVFGKGVVGENSSSTIYIMRTQFCTP